MESRSCLFFFGGSLGGSSHDLDTWARKTYIFRGYFRLKALFFMVLRANGG